ncbi:sensor histidine kinase [Gemmiger sp.]
MISALRRRLTLLMTALTSLVLAGALVVTWNYAAAQYDTSAEMLFEQNFSAICDRLDSADSVSDAWLAEQEYTGRCLLFLRDNGAALHFPGTAGNTEARTALEPLLAEGLAMAFDTDKHDSSGAVQRQSTTFTLDAYRCHAALLPRGTAGSYLLVAAAQDMTFVRQHRVQTVVQYTALWIVGTLLLAAISHALTARALAPTALAMRRQKEFIAAAGHELRSPLTVVKTCLDAARHAHDTERNAFLQSAEQEADRMARLVDDLLLLANGDLDNLPTHLQPVAPDTLCIEVYEQFYLVAKKRQHPLTLTLPDGAVSPIQADPDRVKQLLAILLNNALDHTPSWTPTELILRQEEKNASVTLTVQDHGPGIPDAEKEHIFDRFYSADPGRTAKQNFGLGLSVAKELARLHRATLSVTDTPGGGASFTVCFSVAHDR